MIRTDIAVIGGGLSGLIAALVAAKKGKKVRLITRGAGSLAIAGGCIDVLGYINGKSVSHPFEAMQSLPKNHPYSLLGTEKVQDALGFFRTVCEQKGLRYFDATQNCSTPTVLGSFRPTLFSTIPTQIPTGTLLVINFRSVKDSRAQLAIEGFTNAKHMTDRNWIAIELPNPFGDTHRNITPLDIARYINTQEGLSWFIQELTPHCKNVHAVLLPPVLGVSNHSHIVERLAEYFSFPFIEMASLPPGVGGLRIQQILHKALRDAQVEYIENMHITHAQTKNNKCISLFGKGLDRERTIQADAYIIATGGILGGGITTTPAKAQEEIFHLPLTLPADVQAWSVPDVFAKQPYADAGVMVNEALQAVDANASPLLSNVYFAGKALAGYDFITEKSGHGVAISTGYHAALQAL